jgi:hypothetical protein
MSEQQRWNAQATSWCAVAGACASADAARFYELTSEPLVDDGIDPKNTLNQFLALRPYLASRSSSP